MMEEAPVSAAAAIFVILLLLHLFLEYYSRITPTGQLRPQERELVKEIRELHRAADALATPATFSKSAKLKRSAAAKEKELALLRQNLALQKGWWLSLYSTAPNALEVVVYMILAQWFWHTSVATIPASFLQPVSFLQPYELSSNKESLGGEVAVGILPWLALTSRVSKFVSTKIVGKPPLKSAAKVSFQ
ncbi:tail-anchored protein insertion receptor [Marchantia polymorpha subsp. ruderalis]|uniref:Uncharacterized protein n=2 Tax=Marchantia polymorpha TaxID=3197 RepID=A0AAF6AWQ4_MARPO|nr:hypothetical protein MARPO_0007s0238 [Marchantia polymorpha]BBN04188.1 hypothetical protein Mp_3g02490 [Marchantia polymorpha subsp. ruderalis]|eukprot:PTQ47875.1 hypothetical protein MARPO_0007s0238 [Marchantia polymorpha]